MLPAPPPPMTAALTAAFDGPVVFGVALVATTVDLPVAVVVAGGLVGLLTSLGAAWAIVRMAAIKASLDTIIDANAELRRTNDDLRAELKAERRRVTDSEHRTSVVVDQLAARLVDAVADYLQRHTTTSAAPSVRTSSEGI